MLSDADTAFLQACLEKAASPTCLFSREDANKLFALAGVEFRIARPNHFMNYNVVMPLVEAARKKHKAVCVRLGYEHGGACSYPNCNCPRTTNARP